MRSACSLSSNNLSTSSSLVLSPQSNLWFLICQISPFFVNGLLSISSTAFSTLKLSSLTLYSVPANKSSSSSVSKPVSETIPFLSSSFNKSVRSSVSHSPLILLSAIFNAFSFCSSRSTITQSTSVYPRCFITSRR